MAMPPHRPVSDLDGALADYSAAIRWIQMAVAYAGRDVIKTLQGKAGALEDFEKAFKIDPGLRESYKDFVNKRLTSRLSKPIQRLSLRRRVKSSLIQTLAVVFAFDHHLFNLYRGCAAVWAISIFQIVSS